MKLSIKGYKENSPDKNEKSLIIPSNTLTMKGVTKPITAIPIINGKPDYTQKVVLNPGDSDYTNPKASGFIEIPHARQGLQTPNVFNQPLFETNNFGQIKYNGNTFGQGLGDTTLNIPKVDRSLPEGIRTYEAYQQTMGGSPNTMDQKKYDNTFNNNNNNNNVVPSSVEEAKQMEQDKLQRMMGLLGNSTSPDLQTSLQTLGWSIGFNPSEFNHLSPQAKKTMSGANTALGLASAGNVILKGAYDVINGMGAGKRDTEDRLSMYSKIADQYKDSQTTHMQEGGQTKVLTEGYTTGLPQGSPLEPNTEVEAKEFLKNPQTGQVTEVIGKRHSEGGELMNLEGGTKVISDYLEIGSKLAREFKKEFDLKQLTPKSTFATVIKRFRDKIGLTKKYDELEKLINKIQKQDDVENQNTKELNIQILSEEYKTATEEIEPLEAQLERFTDFIFEHQEYKKAEEKDKERFNNLKKGGVVKTLQEGGMVSEEQMLEIVDAFCDMTNQDPNQVMQDLTQMSPDEQQEALQMMMEAIQQGGAQMQQQEPQQMEQGEEVMMQDGGEIGEEDVQQLIMMFAQATGANPEEIIQQLQSLSPEEQQQMLQEMAQFLQQQMQEQQMMQAGGETGGKMSWFKKQALKFLGKNLEKELTNEDSWHKDNKTLINDSVKWNKEFIDSPKYREMLSKYISEDEIEEELRSRKENINKGFVGVPDTLALNSPYTSVYIPEFSNMLPDIPVINKNKGKVAISTEDAKLRLIPDPFSVYGEVSKQSTQGGKKVPNKVLGEWINKYVNQEHLDNKMSSEKIINKYDKVVIPNERNLTYKGGELYTSYTGNPTNILGFVNSLRAELEAEGVYDPKTESFNGEWIENYNRNYEDNFKRLDSLESLLDVVNPQWRDKGINKEDSVKIGNMMNEIVSNKKGVETSNFYAQEGGETSLDLGQVILAYAQATEQDPQNLAQSLQELSEEELKAEMERMVAELQNLQK